MKNKKIFAFWIVASLLLCVSLGVLAISMLNFKIGGSIHFVADNVYAKVNGKMEGGVQDQTYPELKFEKGANPDYSGWSNSPMLFNDEGADISITITVENLATDRPLYVKITDNYGEVQNITKVRKHNGETYTNASAISLSASTGDKTSVSTFVFTYKITNKYLSVLENAQWGYNVVLSSNSADITGIITAGISSSSTFVNETFNETNEAEDFSKEITDCSLLTSNMEYFEGMGIALLNYEVSMFGVDTQVVFQMKNLRAYDSENNLITLTDEDIAFVTIKGQKFTSIDDVFAYFESGDGGAAYYFYPPKVTITALKNTTVYATVAIVVENPDVSELVFDFDISKTISANQTISYEYAYSYNGGIVSIIGGSALEKNQQKLVLDDNIDFILPEDVVVEVDLKQVDLETLIDFGFKDYLMFDLESDDELFELYQDMGFDKLYETLPYAGLMDSNYLISFQLEILLDYADSESGMLPIVKQPLTIDLGEGEYTFLPENWFSDLDILLSIMETLEPEQIEQYANYFVNINDSEVIVPLHVYELECPIELLEDTTNIFLILYLMGETINDSFIDMMASVIDSLLKQGVAAPSDLGLSANWDFIDVVELVISYIKNDIDFSFGDIELESLTLKNSVLLPNQESATTALTVSDFGMMYSGYYIFEEVQIDSLSYSNCVLGSIGTKKFSSPLSSIVCVDGVAYSADRQTIIAYPGYKEGTEYTLLSTTTTVLDYVFCGARYLQTLNFNQGLQELASSAFKASSIKTIKTTTEFIDNNLEIFGASLYKTQVESVFAQGGTYLTREKAIKLQLHGDVSLEVVYKDNVSNLTFTQSGNGYQVVGASSSLSTIVVPDYYAPSGGSELPVVSIAAGVFQNNTVLSEIYIPSTIKTIGANAFNGCTSLTKLDFGSADITSIGSGNLTYNMEIYTTSATTLATIRSLNANTISVDLDFIIERYDTKTNGMPDNATTNHFTYTLTIGTKSYVYDYDYYLSMKDVLNSTLVILPQSSGNLQVTLTTSLTANAEYNAGIKGILEQISLSKKETNGSYTQVFGTSTDETAFNEYNTPSVSAAYPISGTSYVETGSTLRLRIYYTIMEEAQCFTENTLVTLADGSTKKIKDVGYDDLLMTYDFDRGEFSVSYPAWIATPGEYGYYYLMEFSDGSELEIVLSHRLFNITDMDYNKSIDADYTSIGKTYIKQVMENGQPKLTTVTCTNITKIEETVTYYNMVTSQHLNFFSNGFIGATGIANMYTFDKIDDQTYVHNQQQLEYTKSGTTDDATGTMFSYDRFNKDIIPYYIYVAYRIGEIRNMVNILSKVEPYKNYPLAVVEQYAISLVNDYFVDGYKDEAMQMPSTFKVTYSDNKTAQRYAEGESVTLVAPVNQTNFVGWYNTFDGKIYQPGQTATIYMNTHFIARYN